MVFGGIIFAQTGSCILAKRQTYRNFARRSDVQGFLKHYPMAVKQRLTRSRTHKILGGVCGGIAEYLGWEPTNVRILYVALSVISAAFPGILVYILLWLLMPSE